MKFANVKLIFQREVRDQLRDRRTLFMIAVLPLVLYPLLGLSFFQIAQFLREQPSRVLVTGLPQIADVPPLVEDDRFAAQWLSDPRQAQLYNLQFAPATTGESSQQENEQIAASAREAVQRGEYEAVIVFPDDFGRRLEECRQQLIDRRERTENTAPAPLDIPRPVIYFNTASEKSLLAYDRLSNILRQWSEAIGQQNLKDSALPLTVARPFELAREDVSDAPQRSAAMWSKILPFVLLIWALTGAFYPAVDLCAGEKERGTLETLLSSPARRSEIVTGKLLTVMLFSMATSILNLISMGLTGVLIISHLTSSAAGSPFGVPSLMTPVWLLIALVPIAALFSALCLALAAFARSSKEGQYYLMPLMLVTLPLVILPMGPGMELNLGNSLVPLMGLVLLLRSLLEGNYLAALPYVAPVVCMTLLCCLLAVRWAVEQFNREGVLFRESERLDVGLWLRHLRRDRGDTPSFAEAVFCGIVILMIRFFLGFAMPMPESFGQFAAVVTATQLVMILMPAVIMAIMLTRSPRKTLLLKRPALWTVPAAVALAVALHPAVKLLQVVVEELYPTSQGLKEALGGALGDIPHMWQAILVIALIPAICEELAFRGFILSGFRQLGNKWRAIALSSLMFGITHTVFQQSIITCAVGAVIGYLAVQTGSILPGIVFHFTHNSLMLLIGQWRSDGLLDRFVQPLADGKDFYYAWWVFDLGILVAGVLLVRFASLTRKERAESSPIEVLSQQPIAANA
jgi:sodium transport system permease protein